MLLTSLVCAVLMRLRGGAFTTLTGLSLGTDGARGGFALAVAALMMLVLHAVWPWPLAATMFVGLIVTGWGPFQGFGIVTKLVAEKSWMRWLPERLGFWPGTWEHDAIGLAEAGVVFLAPTALWIGWAVSPLHGLLFLAFGLLWPVAYAIPRVVLLPPIPRFASGQAWGEVFSGAILGVALFLSLTGV